jgi:ferrochelatase
MAKQRAVLLVNLGTPEQPSKQGVRSFLREFLSDRRVVDITRVLWLPLLYLIILPVRSARVARLYKKIWLAEGAPLRFYTRSLSKKLAAQLDNENIHVDYAMTYGQPSIAAKIQQLTDQGINDLTLLPLYPQYSVSTTAPVFDQFSDAVKKQFNFPALKFIHDYHDHPLYIAALVNSVKQFWQEHGQSECLIFSFHGIPKRYVTLGDVYQAQCERTVQLVVEQLGLGKQQYRLCYQSRVGREEWLMPYLDKTLMEMAKNGERGVDIISPAFACDCLETLQELDIENRALFLNSGGKQYRYIPCLNDSQMQVELLAALATGDYNV